MKRLGLSLSVASLCAASLPGIASGSELMRAMRDEMARAVDELRLGAMDAPYFVSYLVRDVREASISAESGGIVSRSESKRRLLTVEVRVGDKGLDNTNFYAAPDFSSELARASLPTALPIADSYDEIRRQIWLATDRSYKGALDQLARKRAALQNENRVEEVPDFSDMDPHVHAGGEPVELDDTLRLAALVRNASAALSDVPHVLVSEARGSVSTTRLSYLNSEGSSFTRSVPSASVTLRGGTQAEDGTVIEDSLAMHGLSLDQLPGDEELARRARRFAERLAGIREAAHMARYAGPVLFEGQAAAELVRRILAPRLLASRAPVVEDARAGRFLSQQANPFLDRVGTRIMPRFLNVIDDPTMDQFESVPLLGGYPVDFEGVPASATSLVERGFLKTLLSTRNPVPGVLKSSGNHRGSGPAPSNLLVESRDGLAEKEMREELLALAGERDLEFAIRIERVGAPLGLIGGRSRGGRTPRGNEGSELGAVVAYKVYPDGREEPIRQAVAVGITESSFRDIVAASEARVVHTARVIDRDRARFGRSPSGGAALASFAVPSLLFEDVTVRRPQGNVPRTPIVSQPPAE